MGNMNHITDKRANDFAPDSTHECAYNVEDSSLRAQSPSAAVEEAGQLSQQSVSGPPPSHMPNQAAQQRRPRILAGIAITVLACGILTGAFALLAMLYLDRGVYHPADVFVLIALCLAIAIAPSLIVAGLVMIIIWALIPAIQSAISRSQQRSAQQSPQEYSLPATQLHS